MWRSRGRLFDVGPLVAAMMIASSVRAEPSPPSTSPRGSASVARIKQAQELVDQALDLYERGEYRAAIAKLESAVELDPSGAELYYNLGLIHERLGEVEAAEKYYRRDLELETDPKLRERAQGILKRLAGARKDLLSPKAAPSSSAAALPAPDSPTAPRRIGPAVIVSSSIAGAALLTGIGFGISALVKNPGSSATTGPGVSVGDIYSAAEQAHRQAIVADVSFVVSAVAAGAALLFYFSLPTPAPTHAAPTRAVSKVDLGLAPGRASLRVVF